MYEYTPFYRIPEWMNRTKWMQRGGSLFILSPMAFAICSGHNLIARWPDRCGGHRCNVIESPEETLHIHQRTEYVAKLDERHVIWIISCKFFVFFLFILHSPYYHALFSFYCANEWIKKIRLRSNTVCVYRCHFNIYYFASINRSVIVVPNSWQWYSVCVWVKDSTRMILHYLNPWTKYILNWP